MTESVHIVSNKSVRDLGIRCFKFSLLYGRNLVCEGMMLNVKRGVATINDNGIFIVGKFDFTGFNFGEWRNAPPGSRDRGNYVLSDESEKPTLTETICLQIEQKDSFSGYKPLKALFSYLPNLIVDARIELNPARFTMLEPQDGKEPEPELIDVVLKSLGKSGSVTYEKLGEEGGADITPELAQEFEELKKHTISDETGSRNAWGRGSSFPSGETAQQRFETRVKVLENKDAVQKIAQLLVNINMYCIDEPAVYGPPLTMNDIIGIMLQ